MQFTHKRIKCKYVYIDRRKHRFLSTCICGFNYICMYAQSPVLGSVVIEYNKQLVLSHKRLGIGTTVQVSK